MDDYLKNQTLEKITKANSILIAVSPESSIDGLASGLALYLSLLKLGKNIGIIAKSPTVGDAQKLYGVDKIGTSHNKKNLVLNIANAITNVDKVTYSLEDKQLKVVIHALTNSAGISQDDITITKEGGNSELLISIGYELAENLKKDITHEQIIDSNSFIININNSKANQNFAQINVLEDGAASISEITTRLLQELAFPIDEDIAFNLYSGIANATRMFSPAHCAQTSFEAAQWLIKFGAGKASLATNTKVQVTRPFAGSTLNEQKAYQETTKIPEETVSDKRSQEEWLKPPKIYHGAKSFDTDS